LQASAQADAIKAGGGVVYFPPGTYNFANKISLASNVLIRGASVGGQLAKDGKKPGNLMPTTIFECPNRLHQGIWNFAPDATNIGVVNVLLDQCAVMFWPSLKSNSFSPMMSSWWFGASDIYGSERRAVNHQLLANATRTCFPPLICSGFKQDRFGELHS
jgi:hypothetical protein